jgi:hypothetical protein
VKRKKAKRRTTDAKPKSRSRKSRRLTMGYVLVSNRVAVDGAPVGYLYREKTLLDENDSGWRIFAGDETQAYVDDPANLALYNASTIVEAAPRLWDVLAEDAPIAFEWDEEAESFVVIEEPTQH